MQLGKQTDISSADRHMLKTGKRRILTGMPHDADTQGLRVCMHTCVSTCAPARLGCSSVRGCPQNAIWLEKQVIFKDNLMCHHQIPHHPGQQTDCRTCLRVISQKKIPPPKKKNPQQKNSISLSITSLTSAQGSGRRASSWHTTALQSRELQSPVILSATEGNTTETWRGARESWEGTKLVLICSRARKSAEIRHTNTPGCKAERWKCLQQLFCGSEPLEGKLSTGTAQCCNQHCVLSTLLTSPFSSHPKSPANQENAPDDCSCWQATVQRSSGLLPWAAAAKSGFPLWIPGCRNWSVSSWEKGGCLEDVGKIFLIGTESLQSISRELGRNGVRVLKRVGSAAALPGKNAQGSQAMEHEPGHSWREGNTCCQQSPGHQELGHQRDTKMQQGQLVLWLSSAVGAAEGHWWCTEYILFCL